MVDSLPGYAPPSKAEKDPLAVIHEARQAKWEARKARDDARQANTADSTVRPMLPMTGSWCRM